MESILIHHGILGQKWGVRHFQNKDGSLTAAGRKRISVSDDSQKTKTYNVKTSKKQNLTDEFPGFKKMNDPYDEEFTNDWIKLQKIVETKSGDFYNGKGKTKAFSNAIKEYEKVSERRYQKDFNYKDAAQYKKYVDDKERVKQKLCSIALNDIGYANTKKNRDMIYSVLFWD